MAEMFPRGDRILVDEALDDTRVVFVLGARQVGKSTLAGEVADHRRLADTITLDDKAPRDAASTDPEGFVAGLRRPALIDEVQRGSPDLLLAIKKIIDEDESPGQFLLTGSANILRNKKVADALTGRMEIVRMWPLAQAEIERSTTNFVDRLFAADPPRVSDAPVGREALRDRITAGGYPEPRLRSGRRRTRWFESYLKTTFEKDLETIADAYKLDEVPRLLRLLAAQAANLFVPSNLGGKLGLHHQTVARYVGLLEAIFLTKRIPAWRPGLGQREVQHPKLYLVDSGLLLHLLGADEDRLLSDDQVTGKALENFVAMELVKHADWSEQLPRLYHYRRHRDEVDLVLENRGGDIVGVEVKSRATIGDSDWRMLRDLREKRKQSFRCGVVIYTGDRTVPLGDRLFAVPLSGLWAQVES